MIEQIINEFYRSDRYLFIRPIEVSHIRVRGTQGLKIGTDSTEKLGFYGVTPVDQPATVSDPTIGSITGSDTVNASAITTNFNNLETAVEAIIDRLQELGLIA